MCVLISLLLLLGDSRPVDAERWLNARAGQDAASTVTLLFFFDPEQRESIAALRGVRRAARSAARVIGVTAATPAATEAFVRKYRLPFEVAAGSRAAAKYGVSKLPAFVLVEADQADRMIEFEELDQLAGGSALGAATQPAGADQVPDRSREALQKWAGVVLAPGDGRQRRAALEQLHDTLSPDQFLEFVESNGLLESENPYVRCSAGFLATEPSADEIQAQVQSPWSIARRSFRAAPDDPQWAEVLAYDAKGRSVAQLAEDYWRHLSDDPPDLLIRQAIVLELQSRPDEPHAVDHILDMLPAESDSSIRIYLIGGMLECQVGDPQAIALLEELIPHEGNMLRVRPFMELTLEYLRRGEQGLAEWEAQAR